jgi:hypothetical protein
MDALGSRHVTLSLAGQVSGQLPSVKGCVSVDANSFDVMMAQAPVIVLDNTNHASLQPLLAVVGR